MSGGIPAGGPNAEPELPLVGRDQTCQIFFEEERAIGEGGTAPRAFRNPAGPAWVGLGQSRTIITFRCSREHSWM